MRKKAKKGKNIQIGRKQKWREKRRKKDKKEDSKHFSTS